MPPDPERLARIRAQIDAMPDDGPGGYSKFLRGTGEFATGFAANIPSWAMRMGRRFADVGAILPGLRDDAIRGALGVALESDAPYKAASRGLSTGIEGYESWLDEHAPDSMPYTLGRVGSEFVTEGGSYVLGGGLLRGAAGVGAMRAAASGVAGRAAGRGAAGGAFRKAGDWLGRRSPTIGGEALKDAVAVAPLDIATGLRRDESTAQVLADVLPEESWGGRAFTAAAKNPLSRIATEAVLGGVADVLVRGIGAGARAAGRAGTRGAAGPAVQRGLSRMGVRGDRAPLSSGFTPGEIARKPGLPGARATGSVAARAGAGAALGGVAAVAAGEDVGGSATTAALLAVGGPRAARAFSGSPSAAARSAFNVARVRVGDAEEAVVRAHAKADRMQADLDAKDLTPEGRVSLTEKMEYQRERANQLTDEVVDARLAFLDAKDEYQSTKSTSEERAERKEERRAANRDKFAERGGDSTGDDAAVDRKASKAEVRRQNREKHAAQSALLGRAVVGAGAGAGAATLAGEDVGGSATTAALLAVGGPRAARAFRPSGLPGKWYSRLKEAAEAGPEQATARRWAARLGHDEPPRLGHDEPRGFTATLTPPSRPAGRGTPVRTSPLEVSSDASRKVAARVGRKVAARVEGGVAEGERKFAQIDELLDAQSNPDRMVTKQEILDRIEERGIQLSETVRGAVKTEEDVTAIRAHGIEPDLDNAGRRVITAHSYGIDDAYVDADDLILDLDLSPEVHGPIRRFFEGEGALTHARHGGLVQPGGSNYREITIQYKHAGRTFKSDPTHGDPDDTVMRIRASDREYANPDSGQTEKVLFVEEAQSDLSQKARRARTKEVERLMDGGMSKDGGMSRAEAEDTVAKDFGYKNQKPLEDFVPPTSERDFMIRQRLSDLRGERRAAGDAGDNPAMARLWEEEDALRTELGQYTDEDAIERFVPDAPFKGADQQVELTLKRIIQEAIDGGYDRVAWVSGRQSADLYGLGKHITELEYNPRTQRLRGYGGEHPLDPYGPVIDTRVEPGDLPGAIGEGPAKRLLETPLSHSPEIEGGAGLHKLEGADINIGGEKHERIYDQLWPRTAKKGLKSLGGVEVEQIRLAPGELPPGYTKSNQDRSGLSPWGRDIIDPQGFNMGTMEKALSDPDFAVAMQAPTNRSFRITPAMRNAAETKGYRLMARGGVGLGVGAVAGTVAPAEEGERYSNIISYALVGGAVEAGGASLWPKINKFMGRGFTAKSKLSAGTEALYDASPDLQIIRGKRATGLEEVLPGDKPLMNPIQKIRYLAMRDVLPIELLDKLVGAGHGLRNALARARGSMLRAEEDVFEFIQPMMSKHGEDGMNIGADLAIAERELELIRLGTKTATPEQIESLEKAAAAARESPIAVKAADELRAQFRRQLDELHDAGVINDEMYQAIMDKGANYVPLTPANLEHIRAYAGGGGGNIYRPLDKPSIRKMRKGKLQDDPEQLITDPYLQLIADEFRVKRMVARQRVADVLAGHVETGKLEGVVEKLKGRPTDFDTDADVIRVNVPRETEKGKVLDATYYRVLDKDLSNAWSSFDRSMSKGLTMKVFEKMRRGMQAGVTYSPDFPMANGIRDYFMSAVQYDLLEGVPVAGRAVKAFGQTRTMAATAAAGAAAGAGTAEEGERVSGALKGAVYATAGVGAAHMAAHTVRNMTALLDIIGPDAAGMIGGGMYGYISGDEENTFRANLGRFVVGASMGRFGGHVAGRLGLKGDPAHFKRFKRDGAGQFGVYDDTAMKTPAQLLKELERLGVDRNDVLNPQGWGHAIQMIMHPWEALRKASSAIETAPRLAFYKRQMERGMEVAGGVPTREQSEGMIGESVFGARDLGLDFSIKAGSEFVRGWTSVTPFMRPMLLGMDKMVRMMGNEGTREIAVATVMAPSIALWMLIKSDPDIALAYDERPDYEKNSNWLVPKRLPFMDKEEEGEEEEGRGYTGGFWRVPKPFELGHVAASIPERMLDDYFELDDVAASARVMNMMGGMAENLKMTTTAWPSSLLPMPVGPLIQGGLLGGEHGHDIYRDRPINPYPWRNVEGQDQYTAYTSTVALYASRDPVLGAGLAKLGFDTPAKVDFMITGYGGTVARHATDLTSRYARDQGWDTRPEPIGQRKLFEGRFSTRPTTSGSSEIEFRQEFDEVEEAYNSWRQLLKAGDGEEATQRFGNDNAEGNDKISRYYIMRNFKNTIDELTSVRRLVRESPSIEVEDRERMVIEINTAIAGLARRSNEGVRKVMEQRAEERQTGER